jgi:hypothetical protein
MEAVCEKAIAEYLSHLNSQFVILPDRDGCRLVTPFERQDGESIEVRVTERADGQLLLTDDGMTSDYLFLSGVNLESSDSLFQEASGVAQRYGVTLDMASSEIFLMIPAVNVGSGLHQLMSAIVAVGDMLFKRAHRSISTFDDEVEGFFLERNIVPQKRLEVRGQSALHTITFYVNGQRRWLLEPVSVMSRNTARNRARLLAFQWMDIKNITDAYRCIAILDDRQRQMELFWADHDVAGPLFEYSDVVVEWSQRDILAAQL